VVPALVMIVVVVPALALTIMVIVMIAIITIAIVVILTRATRWGRDPGSGEANPACDEEKLEPPGSCGTLRCLSRGFALSLCHRLRSAHDTLRSETTLAQRSAL
jgi:hypothetical protein